MPVMARLIESCGYNEETPAAAFRYKNFGIIVYPREILVMNAGDKAPAVEVLDFLKDIIETAGTRTENVKPS
jgi:ArsR family metal-binding transcriptional regulator